MDRLHTAIAERKQVSFKYFNYNIKKEKQYRKNGEPYLVSPYALSWDDENYYLITFSEKYNGFTHYRVDRMTNIEILDKARGPLSDNGYFNIAEYTKKVFNMFGGEEETVRLQFDNSLVNAVIDRYGKDVLLDKVDENSFSVRIDVAISSTFFAWVAQFGNKVKVLSPESVVEKYKRFIQEILEQYE